MERKCLSFFLLYIIKLSAKRFTDNLNVKIMKLYSYKGFIKNRLSRLH